MSEISSAIKQICEEKKLSYDAVLETIESALAAAYRKDFGEKNQNIKVEFNPETAKSKIYDVKLVVEDMPEIEEDELENLEEKEANKETLQNKKPSPAKDKKEEKKETSSTNNKEEEGKKEGIEEEEERRFNPKTEIQISDAKKIKKTVKVGQELKMKLSAPEAFGRMAAQTAKQVIIQKLREAERDMVYNEFKDKVGEVVSGVVQRQERRVVLVDLGKSVGVLPIDEQIMGERYEPGARVKIFVKEVNSTAKGPEIVLSRRANEILEKIFYLEIPEISNGLIDVKSVAREAGKRSKIAVAALNENVDPIGSCVGQRGARIQTIINELGGEKVDIIEYDEDPAKFLSNALSPAKITSININEESKEAEVIVSSDQLSLAIGKGGQNVRLAARLTGWKIDIKEEGSDKKTGEKVADLVDSEKENKKITKEETEKEKKDESSSEEVKKSSSAEKEKDSKKDKSKKKEDK